MVKKGKGRSFQTTGGVLQAWFNVRAVKVGPRSTCVTMRVYVLAFNRVTSPLHPMTGLVARYELGCNSYDGLPTQLIHVLPPSQSCCYRPMLCQVIQSRRCTSYVRRG